MRQVHDDRDAAEKRGRRGAEEIRRTHSPEAAGEVIAKRLGPVRTHLERVKRSAGAAAETPRPSTAIEAPASEPRSLGFARATYLVERGPTAGAGGGNPIRRLVRRLALLVTRPTRADQHAVNRNLVVAIQQLHQQVGYLQARDAGAEYAAAMAAFRKRDRELESIRSEVAARERDMTELQRAIDHLETIVGDGDASLTAFQQEELAGLRNELVDRIEALQTAIGVEPAEPITIEAAARPGDADTEKPLRRPEALAPPELRVNGGDGGNDLSTLAQQHAELAAQADAALRSHHEELNRISQQLGEAMRLVAESRAIPFMEDPPFENFEHPQAGTVTGFRESADGGATDGYLGFENIFRGSEEMIRERQSRYVDMVAGHTPVLDAGCGRGEFLDLLRDAGIDYAGVDLEAEMVEHCRGKGHSDVARADINEYLEGLEDDSLGTIFSAQLIEHLAVEDMRRFIALSVGKLKPGGLFIAETVNPHSAQALKTFWVDPTHNAPVYPEVALVLCRLAGFGSGFVFHPNGKGDVEADRFSTGEYAVVATAPERSERSEATSSGDATRV
jgi:SAM-dependent methyltransferase